MSNEWQEIVNRVRDDWGEHSFVLTIVEGFRAQLRPDTVRLLTMPMFEAFFPNISRQELHKAIMYFTGDRLDLLNIKFGIFDDQGYMHDLDAHEVKEYLKNRMPVVDPRNGELLANLDDALVYFQGTDKLKTLLRNP